MRVTLHVDLPETTLADFAEHIRAGLITEQEDILGGRNVLPWLEHGEGDNDWVLRDSTNRRKIAPQLHGTTAISYVFQDAQAPYGRRFILTATRYRTDRLKLTLTEYDDSAVYAARLRSWLLARWGSITEHPIENAATAHDRPLTRKESEVAALIAAGDRDPAIARKLIITEATVKKHRQRIGEKWNVSESAAVLEEAAKRRGYGGGTTLSPEDTL